MALRETTMDFHKIEAACPLGFANVDGANG